MTEPSQDPLRALLVEDDAGIGRIVKTGLHDRGIDIDWLRTGLPALEQLRAKRYDVVILDLMLPDIDGFELCRSIRAAGNTTPLCMLTARDDLDDKLDGFAVGADDYLTKPFAIEELSARLHALARRSQQPPRRQRIEFDALCIDVSAREVSVGDDDIALTQREFDVLTHLALHAQEVVSREQLLEVAWGAERELTLNAVDVYVGYLRRKLGELPLAPQIKTIRGVGFKLC